MIWTQESIRNTVEAQRRFFRSGATLDVSWRIAQLKALKAAVRERQDALLEALRLDLGRSDTESYFCDIGSSIVEINEAIRGLRRWAKPETRRSGLMLFPSFVTKVYKLPYGVSLIISPFNFPILLTLGVLTACIAGGNTAVIKTSAKSPNCTAALRELLASVFPPEYVTLVEGGHEIGDLCLAERFDKIFYTGSPEVGRHVLSMAAENLTPAALELGGETGNWCVHQHQPGRRRARGRGGLPAGAEGGLPQADRGRAAKRGVPPAHQPRRLRPLRRLGGTLRRPDRVRRARGRAGAALRADAPVSRGRR